jgi:hypothetical protein
MTDNPIHVRLHPSRNLQYDVEKILSTHACNCATCTTASVLQVSMTIKYTPIPGAPPKYERQSCLIVKVSTRGQPDTFYGPTPLGYEEQLTELAKECLKATPLYWKMST